VAAVAVVSASGSGCSWCERRRWLELDGDGERLDIDDGGGASGHDVRRSRLVTSSFPSYPSLGILRARSMCS
jgi:hypothetical protein